MNTRHEHHATASGFGFRLGVIGRAEAMARKRKESDPERQNARLRMQGSFIIDVYLPLLVTQGLHTAAMRTATEKGFGPRVTCGAGRAASSLSLIHAHATQQHESGFSGRAATMRMIV